jgi:hypothetical protein
VSDTEEDPRFVYGNCSKCGRDQLAFALCGGECFWCRGVLKIEGAR